MSNLAPYPWQQSLWSVLVQRAQAGRLPHALLLTGPTGMGKRDFAERFSHALLCETPAADGQPCGHCRGCLLLQAGSHPDYLRVEPEEEGKAIGVDAIRALSRFQGLKSQYGRQRVIQLQPADALNANAANALLKTLEEPAGETVLLLTTGRPMSLLATVRSRCQQQKFQPLAKASAEVEQWLAAQLPPGSYEPSLLLQMAGGAPLQALALASGEELALREELLADLAALEQGEGDPVTLGEKWYSVGSHKVLPWLYRSVADMVKLKLAPAAQRLHHPLQRQQLQALAEQVDLYFLQALLDKVQGRIGLLHRQANQQVILEELLLAWKQRRI
ncbi:MAG TPA: DNA polymerase III subunit delta' [Gammaproteobacteria bacterium]